MYINDAIKSIKYYEKVLQFYEKSMWCGLKFMWGGGASIETIRDIKNQVYKGCKLKYIYLTVLKS